MAGGKLADILAKGQSEFDKDILSGKVKNCFVRLDMGREPAADIFSPRLANEDRWELRDVLDERIVHKKEWLDSELRIFFNKDPVPSFEEIEILVNTVTDFFSGKYPNDFFLQYKDYSCGPLTRIIVFKINNNLILKYCEELRRDFTKNFCKVIYEDNKTDCVKLYVNTYEMGTLEYKNGLIEMHRWENEDEAQAVSYLSKHYTQRLLDGAPNRPDAQRMMLDIIKDSMADKKIDREEKDRFIAALELIRTFPSA